VTKDYTDDLKQALRDLLAMASEKEQLETKIAKQKKRAAALYELVAAEGESAAITGLVEGVTDACRTVFRAAEKPLLPAEVRDRVQALGLPPQANLLASIHTTIKRMKEAEEIEEVSVPLQTGGMGTAYKWNHRRHTLADLAGGSRSDNHWYSIIAEMALSQEASMKADADSARKLIEGARFPKAPRPPNLNK
jgi:hypothetical protein